MYPLHVPAVVEKISDDPLFSDPLRNRTQEQSVPPFPCVGPPLPCPILPGRGSSRVHYVGYTLAEPSSFLSCCESPCRSLHKFRFLARTISQPRTRAVQPEKRSHGTCLAIAQGEIHDRSLFGRCYRFVPQIQLRISIQHVLIGIVSCVPLTLRLFFLHGFYAATAGSKTPQHRTALKKALLCHSSQKNTLAGQGKSTQRNVTLGQCLLFLVQIARCPSIDGKYSL